MHAGSAEELVTRADQALYWAKARGKETVAGLRSALTDAAPRSLLVAQAVEPAVAAAHVHAPVPQGGCGLEPAAVEELVALLERDGP